MSLPLLETRESSLPDNPATRVRSARPLVVVRETEERVAQLYAALRRAEAERDANGAFLSYISHELRSPLTTVVGMADLLKESQLSADQRDMIAIMRRSAEANPADGPGPADRRHL